METKNNKAKRMYTNWENTIELADELAYALFEDELDYNKRWHEWMDSVGITLEITSEWEEVIESLPSGLLFWIMKKHYQANHDICHYKNWATRTINDFWTDIDRLSYISSDVCLNSNEWWSVRDQKYNPEPENYDYDEEEYKNFRDETLEKFCEKNPYISGIQAYAKNPVKVLPKRAYTCVGHYDVFKASANETDATFKGDYNDF